MANTNNTLLPNPISPKEFKKISKWTYEQIEEFTLINYKTFQNWCQGRYDCPESTQQYLALVAEKQGFI